MTDNGPAYLSRAWAACCARRGLRHLRTRPYTPRTNWMLMGSEKRVNLDSLPS